MWYLRDPDLDSLSLTSVSRSTVAAVAGLPFSTSADLGHVLGRSPNRVDRTLRRLEDRGLLDANRFYFGPGSHYRWSLAVPDGSAHLPGRLVTHPPQLLDHLLGNMEMVAATYELLADVLSVGPDRALVDFRWFRDQSFSAAARFTDGWVVFLWSGVWNTPARIAERIMESRASFPRVDPQSPRRHLPGLWCWVVPDPWQARLVLEAADDAGLAAETVVQVVQPDERYGMIGDITSDGWFSDPDVVSGGPSDELLNSLSDSIYCRTSARLRLRLLSAVEQWPDVGINSLARLASCHVGRSAHHARVLVSEEYLRSDAEGHYSLGPRGYSFAARRDRVWAARVRRRRAPGPGGAVDQHERGLAGLLGRFRQGGAVVAGGWRGVENHGREGSIHPDGLVRLSDGPFGPGWYYVEYERAAVSPSTIRRKLRPLVSPDFDPLFPFLYVCRPRALRHFVEAISGLPVAVATTDDVRRLPVLGGRTAWYAGGDYCRVIA